MKKGTVLALEVVDLAFGGRGIAKLVREGEERPFAIFVDGALPGQTVEARITRVKKRYAEAKILKVIMPSSQEVEVPYQATAGAPWMRLPVDLQLSYKVQQVKDLFQKLAAIDLENPPQSPFGKGGGDSILDESMGSPEAWHYRNKMEWSFGPTSEERIEIEDGYEWKHSGFGLGSKKRGQFWLVESLKTSSGLFDQSFEEFLSTIREFCEKTNLPVYNARTNAGFWRHLVVRKSFSQDKILINLVTSVDSNAAFIDEFISLITTQFGDRIGGIFWTQSDDVSDPVKRYKKRNLVYGEPTLMESLQGLEFEISLDSFFQTNVHSAEKLYQKVVDCVDLSPGSVVADLYCGTGTIAQILAKNSPESSIWGVEIVKAAVEDARKNAERNQLQNVEFYAGDVRKFLYERKLENKKEKLDCIVLDPPRSGIAPKALQRVVDFKAPQIVYVSCNPATMARDTLTLKEAGYHLEKLSIVDQFPHTSHVECVGSFRLKS
jgi:23S rRNA (uracil-5-)-methyltransferase RumA